MVDLALLQSVSYIAGALGVCVAATYYVMNMKETSISRRLTLTNNLMQFFTSIERQRRGIELFQMEWKDFEDFLKKYDSTVNPDNYALRAAFWNQFEMIGLQYRTGLIDIETIYAVGAVSIMNTWMRFKPIIYEYRKRDFGVDSMKNWEYLAIELAKLKAKRDPSWKGSKSYLILEEYDKAFK